MNTVTPLGHIIVDYANCNVTLGTYRLRERVCPSWKKLKMIYILDFISAGYAIVYATHAWLPA